MVPATSKMKLTGRWNATHPLLRMEHSRAKTCTLMHKNMVHIRVGNGMNDVLAYIRNIIDFTSYRKY